MPLDNLFPVESGIGFQGLDVLLNDQTQSGLSDNQFEPETQSAYIGQRDVASFASFVSHFSAFLVCFYQLKFISVCQVKEKRLVIDSKV